MEGGGVFCGCVLFAIQRDFGHCPFLAPLFSLRFL